MNIPRPEFPRPDFARTDWMILNGEWQFAFDDMRIGEKEHWYEKAQFTQKIVVPFVYQCPSSYINTDELHPVMWYSRTFSVSIPKNNRCMILHFGAVDFEATVWINGKKQGSHRGGYTPFSFDITDDIHEGENLITVKVSDEYDCAQPRGKQFWEKELSRCWYTPSSGIWQSVWCETVSAVHIERVKLTPHINTSTVEGVLYLNKKPNEGDTVFCTIHITYKGNLTQKIHIRITERISRFTCTILESDYIDEIHYWSPENPNLYDITYTLTYDENVQDTVSSYFGMRSITIRDGHILFNNKPLYQRLVLAQGYWQESLLTAPSDDALKNDILLIKSLGFNGVRMHQKIEDPRFYYWADKLGLFVWGEMPSSYHFSDESCRNTWNEWEQFIRRDYNHPCIILWVPLNESWGVRNIIAQEEQQQFALSLYHQTKALDPYRPISTNDGWEQVTSDICGIHDYVKDKNGLLQTWQNKDTLMSTSVQGRMIYANGYHYTNEPVLLTEFGGIAFVSQMNESNWGYSGGVQNEQDFIERMSGLIEAMDELGYIQGFCYTQLTDVMQEVNGLTDIHRTPKIAIEKLAKIISGT